jgi:hypothetical protein
MSDSTLNIELHDIQLHELECGVVAGPAGRTGFGSPSINVPDGGNKKTLIWVTLNDHILQWLSRIDSADRRRKLKVWLVFAGVMCVLSLVAFVIFYYLVVL